MSSKHSRHRLVIRTDASATVGMGHAMRCLALAQGCRDAGHDVTFLLSKQSSILQHRLNDEGMAVRYLSVPAGSAQDARRTASVAASRRATWVVVDGYHFDATYQQTIKASGTRLLVIDDNAHASHYTADLILNQNVHADETLYAHREPSTALLLGTNYALLQRSFNPWRGWQRTIADVGRKLLITLGGSDPNRVTFKIIQALKEINAEKLATIVVIGAANSDAEELYKRLKTVPASVQIMQNVTDMPQLMAWADMAIAAGGTTSWELAFMGLPCLMLILADNQRPTAEALHTRRCAINLGWHTGLSASDVAHGITNLMGAKELRAIMAQRGPELVDGKGVTRVLERLVGISLKLRRIDRRDCKLLWSWANDPQVRAVSFSPQPIAWEKHVEWFERKVNDPDCLMYMALSENDQCVGQVRFDRNGREALVSITIDRKFRGKGYGSLLIALASEEIFKTCRVDYLDAYIKPCNQASIKAFSRAGFDHAGTELIQGCEAIRFRLQKGAVYHEE